MAVTSYAYEIDSIIIYKFGALLNGTQPVPNKSTALDLTPQVHEVSIFQSIFSPVVRAEIALFDMVGLFVNFPISGEEVVVLKYRNIADNSTNTLYFVVDTIKDINIGDDARSVGFMMNCVAIEAYANAKMTVQQAYEGSVPSMAKKLFDEHINTRIKQFFPSYPTKNMFVEDNDSQTQTVVIPNMSPFAGMKMLSELAVSEVDDKSTYVFYQTFDAFNFRTIQGLYDAPNARRIARLNGYKYFSNELEAKESEANNEGRVIANLHFNKRHATYQKMATGYFHNNHFEINIAQKSFWGQPTRLDASMKMGPQYLNSASYIQSAYVEGDDEQSNRTRYTVTTQKENDPNFPLSRARDKWGKDLIQTIAMSQIDLTVTIPGTNRFQAGDLFWADIPEMHGMNEIKEDDLVSGIFIITEIKHVLSIGGYHTTVLRINKDSYNSAIDRPSRYV